MTQPRDSKGRFIKKSTETSVPRTTCVLCGNKCDGSIKYAKMVNGKVNGGSICVNCAIGIYQHIFVD